MFTHCTHRWNDFLAVIFLMFSGLAVGHAEESPRKPPKPIKALLITGGCCHDYTAQKELLSKGLMERAHIDVEVVEQGGRTTNTKIPLYENENWAEGFDVVLHDECFSDIPDKDWTQRVLKPHKAGLPAVVIHCAMHCYRDGTDEWFKFCGVTSRRHGAHYPHEVLNRDGDHPIMKGWGPAWANPAGELYWIEKVWPTAHPLAASKNKEKGNEEVCVWTNEFGEKKTRVFGTTLGHHNETVQSPQFLDLVTKGTLWACGKLNDEYLKPVKPKVVPVNEAKGKTAKASSEETGKSNFAKHAVDGDPATRWCASSGEYPQWLEVDLGAAQHVTGCRIDWENPAAAYRFKVEGSVDGKEWKTLVDQSENKESKQARFEIDGTVQHIKLTVLGGAVYQWASLWEFAIFGDKTIVEDPAKGVSAKEAALLKEVKVPEGFEATLFAAPPAVVYPVFVAAAPDSVTYVSVDRNGSLDRQPYRGSVYRLRDIDGDGRADEVKLFVADVDSPRGLVWDHDRLYLMHPPHLSAFIDKDHDGIADEQKILVKNIAFGFKDRPADHTSNGVTLGIDGWLYLAIGDFGFLEAEGTDGRKLQLRGGGVVRVRPDGTGLELFSRGTRNILEVGLDPLLNGFARDNTNDGGGWDIRLHHFTGGEDHGYPRKYKNFASEIVAPLADYGGGSGCGALYLSEPGFPEGYGDALYTADWGRSWIYRHNFTPRGATFIATQEEFVAVPRVTDLDVDAMSRVYATSWRGATFTYAGEDVGMMVQVRPKGYRPEPLPDLEKLTDAELIDAMSSPSHRRRLEAQRALLRRSWATETESALENAAQDHRRPLATRVAALFALKQALGAKSHPIMIRILNSISGSDELRASAIRALTDRKDQSIGIPAAVLENATKSPIRRVRLEAAAGIGRLQLVDRAALLLPLLDDFNNPPIPHTAEQSLVALIAVDACLDALKPGKNAAEFQRLMSVLGELKDAKVVDAMIQRLKGDPESAVRDTAFWVLCRLHWTEGVWKGDSWGTRPDTTGPYYQPESWSETTRIAGVLKEQLNAASASEVSLMLQILNQHRITLDNAVEKSIKIAGEDKSFEPIAAAQVFRASTLPEKAIPLLKRLAAERTTKPSTRSHAVQSLMRGEDPELLPTILIGLSRFQEESGGSVDFTSARDAFLNSAALERRLIQLKQLAVTPTEEERVWAIAGLLILSTSKQVSAETRDVASQAISADSELPERRRSLLQAALLANHRESQGRVYAGIEDSDPAVVAAAKKVASAWKLDLQPTPAGPAIKSLKMEDVLAAVLKEKGTKERGEAVYTRLNCGKCHTTRMDEPLRGPFLPAVAKTQKREQLAESILQPSKTLAQGFVTYVFILDDGKTITGFVTKEAADEVIVRDGEGKEFKLAPAKIEERVKQNISVMPDNVAKEITVSDLASLLTYLQSLASP